MAIDGDTLTINMTTSRVVNFMAESQLSKRPTFPLYTTLVPLLELYYQGVLLNLELSKFRTLIIC